MQFTIAYHACVEISSLRLFVEVMHHRNFTDVAMQLGIAPSSVSRTIAGLEKELGIRLFQRSTRRLESTEAGLIYFERILPIINELEAAKQVAIDVNDEPRGILRITASTVYGQTNITPLLPEFSDKYPSLTIELLLTDSYLDLIEERIDIAIRLGSLQDSSYIARQINSIEFIICASPDYIEKQGKPTAPDEVAGHNCLIFPRSGYSHNWLFKDKNEKIKDVNIQGKCIITNSGAIKQCAVLGMGLALLPDWLVCDEIKSGTLIRLFSDYSVSATDFESGIYLLYPSREYTPLKTQMFIEYFLAKTNNITAASLGSR